MRITSFHAIGLNGYLDFDLKLNDSLNFLIGINGSGKTSILRAVMALLGPDLDWLMTAQFETISVSLVDDGKTTTVIANRNEDGRTFIVQDEKKVLDSSFVSDQEYHSLSRQNSHITIDENGDYINVQETVVDLPTNKEALNRIKRLPVPVFLGLDRSNLPFARLPASLRRQKIARRPHATLRSFLDESVAQAEHAATQARTRAKVERDLKAAKLREDMLLTLFTEPSSGSLIPEKSDPKKYDNYRVSLKQAFSVLGLNRDRVESTVDPFFSNLIETGSKIAGKDINEIIGKKATPDSRKSFHDWMDLSPRLPLITSLEKLVSEFNSVEREIFQSTNIYIKIMNSFLDDSGKTLFFDDDSTLKIKTPSGNPSNVQVLSSGERQLFVLITTLMFGEDLSSSILIIDEPELSLHLKWQEMFVSAITEANPSFQLIFATHSPSIILDNEQFCVDLV